MGPFKGVFDINKTYFIKALTSNFITDKMSFIIDRVEVINVVSLYKIYKNDQKILIKCNRFLSILCIPRFRSEEFNV